jgi:hypothetical protein
MPLTAASESPDSSGRLKWSERLVVNSRVLKWMAYILNELDTEQRWVSSVATVSLHR